MLIQLLNKLLKTWLPNTKNPLHTESIKTDSLGIKICWHNNNSSQI